MEGSHADDFGDNEDFGLAGHCVGCIRPGNMHILWVEAP